jgi:hypothetical protein
MNPITMKRYIKTPLKFALPLLIIGALVVVSISGCTSPNLSPSPSASSVPTATPTPTPTATPTPTPSPSPSPAQTTTKRGPLGATFTQGGVTATFENYGPVSYTQVTGGVPSREYWQGRIRVSGTIYYNPANPPLCGYIWSDGDTMTSRFDVGLESWEQTLGTHTVNSNFIDTGSHSIALSPGAHPATFELIVPGSPGSGATYTFIWTVTGT